VNYHSVTYAQEFNEQQIKSDYMINLFHHITWSNEENKKVFNLTIYKDRDYVTFLSHALKNQKIKNKPVVVTYANNLEELKQGDSAYIPQKFNDNIPEIAHYLRNSNTLLITSNSTNKHDVMINLSQQKNSTAISFEVNKVNITYEKLNISNDLLRLGGIEYDIATLYREAKLAMQKTKLQGIDLKNGLLKKQQELVTSVQQLNKSKKALNKLNKLNKLNNKLTQNIEVSVAQKKELEQLKKHVSKKQRHLDTEKKKLEFIIQKSISTENQLFKQQKIFTEQAIKNEEILATVEQNKRILKQQKTELSNHKIQLKEQGVELTDKTNTISNQQTYIFLTTVITVLAIFSAILIIFFFNKNKKTTHKLTKTLSNLNETQEQLIQSEKMASLGRLVAGVAHEINTPLSIAITANSLILEKTLDIKNKISSASLSKGHMTKYVAKTEESLTMSENALERVKNLLASFKMVAADQMIGEPREINLTQYITEVMSTLSVEIKKRNVSYQYNDTEDHGTEDILISTIPGVFSQVISNLVMNSLIHGFDDKQEGKIIIALQRNTDNKVIFSYHDNGKGMDKYTLDHIFEPFFTTKRGMGSTGLGMNIVFNLINQQLNGTISVDTEQGKGTLITVILPNSIHKYPRISYRTNRY
jgi:signal transduction histidine kinase